MIQFNSDHAIQLRNSIASFQLIYSEELVDLIQKLQNLQQVWNDTHRLDFEQDFPNLTSTHQQIDQYLQHHLQEIDRVTNVVEKLNEKLINFDSLVEGTVDSQPQGIPTTVSNKDGFTNSKEPYSKVTEQDVQNWQKSWVELSQGVTPFLNKICAASTLSLSLFGGIISSAPVNQVIKLSKNNLISAVEFIVGDFQNLVDLNTETLGSDWSSLPDESIPKVSSKITEDAEKLHFGNDKVADCIGEYADDEEEKRKRRIYEQGILNQLRSKFSQNSKRK
jgi:hypothetical protein